MRSLSILFVLLFAFTFSVKAQDAMKGIDTLYVYRTQGDFFKGKYFKIIQDSILFYSGKIRYIDKATGKKVKYHMIKDSAFFGFRVQLQSSTEASVKNCIFLHIKGEKEYGVYLGGNENFYFVLYFAMYVKLIYDKNNYASVSSLWYYSPNGCLFGFVKTNCKKSKMGDTIDKYIKDNSELYAQYKNEYKTTRMDRWYKNILETQIEYLKKYNKVE